MTAPAAGAAPRTSGSGAGVVAGSLFGFVVLGLPDGMLGVAWPSMRASYHQPLGALGELLLAALVAYLLVASSTGRALHRFGAGTLLVVAAGAAGSGSILLAASPAWPIPVAAAFLLGGAGGALDAGLNTVVSLAHRPRLMNLLHAAYGVGATLGPLVVTVALAAASSWRAAYAALAVLEAALLGVWIGVRAGFARGSAPGSRVEVGGSGHDRPPGAGRHRWVLALSLALFFGYTGLEASAGTWAASYLRGHEAMGATPAGIGVFLYWSGLTAGRFAAAGLGARVSAEVAARTGVVVSLAGAGALWAGLGPGATVAALLVLGLGLGPVFPALVTLTPWRLGTATAVHAVGWELAAAGVGGAALSALAGLVLQVAGLAALGPMLTVMALAVLGLNLGVERLVGARVGTARSADASSGLSR